MKLSSFGIQASAHRFERPYLPHFILALQKSLAMIRLTIYDSHAVTWKSADRAGKEGRERGEGREGVKGRVDR